MPDVRTRTAGGWRSFRALATRAGSGWKPLKEVYARTPSGWKKVWPSTAPLTVVVVPETQPWPTEAPYRVSTSAIASGGVEPYTYGWNDTGPAPYPPGSGYAGQFKTWESVGGRADAFVSVIVTDALGNTASAGGNITEFG